jgi:hypothetical protein
VSAEGQGLHPAEDCVDCEYNRDGHEPKRVRGLAKRVRDAAGASDDWPTDDRAQTVYPDIVVHRRGAAGPNLIVLEVKRRGAPQDAIERDEEKLALYQEQLHYQHAFLVLFERGTAKVQPVKCKSSRVGQ